MWGGSWIVYFEQKPDKGFIVCAQFTLKIKANELSKKFGIKIPEKIEMIDQRILPYRSSLVVVGSNGAKFFKEMNFSLIPSWSKEPRVKFATHNARLDSLDEKTSKFSYIFEKPTWKKPFLKQHCIIPISEFIEPIYRGQYANHMVRFFQKDGSLLVAAGIWDEWVNKETGEVLESFSILTDSASKFVSEIGHERQPVFIKESFFDEWLFSEETKGEKLVEKLRSNKEILDLTVTIDRPLKSKTK